MKVIPKGITERIWFNNYQLLKMVLIEILPTKEKVKISETPTTAKGSLCYCDIQFPDRDGYFLVAATGVESVYDVQSFKVGTTSYEFLFSTMSRSESNLYMYDESGAYKGTSLGENLGISLGPRYYFIHDVTGMADGKYFVSSTEKTEFKRYKKPATIEDMRVDVTSGKILIQPGFNLIAWQGKGTGSYDAQSDACISKVANAIASQLNLKYGTTSWRGCRTYDEKNGVFLDYINGVTPDDADGNFSLVVSDGGNREVKGIEFFSLSSGEMELEYF